MKSLDQNYKNEDSNCCSVIWFFVKFMFKLEGCKRIQLSYKLERIINDEQDFLKIDFMI